MGNVLLSYTPQDYIKTITSDETISGTILRELFRGEEWVMLDAGMITEEEAIARVQARIPQHAAFVQKAMDDWHCDLTPIEGMPELVTRLKEKGYRIYLLSNTSLRFYRYQHKVKMFELFDGFLISAKEQLMKPDKAIFEHFLLKFNLIGEECLFIDDLSVNVQGAQASGISAYQFCGANALKEHLKRSGIL